MHYGLAIRKGRALAKSRAPSYRYVYGQHLMSYDSLCCSACGASLQDIRYEEGRLLSLYEQKGCPKVIISRTRIDK